MSRCRNLVLGMPVLFLVFALTACSDDQSPAPEVRGAVLESSTTTTTTRATSTSTTTATTAPRRIFTRADYAELATSPDRFEGASVDIVGRVFAEVERQGDVLAFQMWADPAERQWNTVVGVRSDIALAADDFVHVVGEVRGKFEGKNAFGATVEAVQVAARTVEKVDGLAAAPPAVREVALKVTQNQHGLVVTIDKVQYAAAETRVFVTVTNNTPQKASFYDFNAKATQGSQQFDVKTTYGNGYPEVQSELLPRVTSSGVVMFPAMNPRTTARLVLEARTDDYRVDFADYVFNVPA
jgi:hypothetical protein